MRINIAPCSNLRPAHGYGKLELGVTQALHDLGIEMRVAGLAERTGIEMLPQAVQTELFKPGMGDITLVVGRPEMGDMYPVCNTRRFLYTMSESTRVSDEWVRDINKYFEAVIVTAPELVDIYKSSGVRVPVYYVPCGITAPTNPINRTTNPDRTVFLTYSLGDMRKGAELAVLAHGQAFGNDPRHQLWIKAPDRKTWVDGAQVPNITLIKRRLSEAEWYDLLSSVDCFVFPSRGEGFGLPPREATLAGTPTIATQWLGMHDIDCWGFPIRVQEMRPAPFEGAANHQEASWSEPDLAHLTEQMIWVAEHKAEALEKAKAGRAYLEGFTWRRCAQGLMEVICGQPSPAR